MTTVIVTVGLLVTLYSQCVAHVLASDQRCVAKRISVNPNAEARFTYLIKLREGGDGDICGKLAVTSVQFVAILEWAVNKLNTANFVPGVEIGFDVLGDCGVARYGVRNTLDVLSQSYSPNINDCSGNQTSKHLGMVGPSSSQLTEAVLQVLNGTDVPVLGPSATLPNLSLYTNFLRVSPSDTEQVKVIVDLMVQLQLTYVAGIYTDDNYGIGGMRAIKELAEKKGICIDVMQELSHVPSDHDIYGEVLNKLLEQQLRSKDHSLCVVYFGQADVIETLLYVAENKKGTNLGILKLFWIMSDFVGTNENVFKEANHVSKRVFTVSPTGSKLKDLQSNISEKWKNVAKGLVVTAVDNLIVSLIEESGDHILSWKSGYIQPTLDALYVIAVGLKEKHSELCHGQTGICSQLHDETYNSLLTKFQTVNISYDNLTDAIVPLEFIEQTRHLSFDNDGELVIDTTRPIYDVFIYNGNAEAGDKFSVIGQFQKNTLQLNTSRLPDLPLISECKDFCLACRTTPEFPYIHLEGDLYLIGIFSHHEQNNDEPFECGEFRNPAPDIIAMEAFLHAMGRLRNITGLKFGALVFDDCYSPVRTGLMMSSVMSGYGALFNNMNVDPSKIVGVVGAPSSGVTVPIAMFFSRLNINMVSYSASSPDLDDRINYPHFLRTVPSDVEQAKVMVEIITSMGWEYVSLLYVDNNYGRKGADAFVKVAVEKNICVANPPIAMKESTDDITEAYIKLSEIRSQRTRVVVYFGILTRMSDLLAAMKYQLESENVRQDFIFIASEDWGDDKRILEEARSVALGSITLKNTIENSADIGLEEYLSEKSIETNHINPWFSEFWMEYFKCSIMGGYDQRYDRLCTNDGFTQQYIQDYLEDQRVIHVMNAVYALGIGLQKAIDDLCRYETGYPVCSKLFEEADKVTRHIRTVDLMQNNRPFKVFKDDGNGDIGFKILNIHQQGDTYIYKQVGTYDANNLILNKNWLKFYDKSEMETDIEAKCTVDLCGTCAGVTSETVIPPQSINMTNVVTDAFRLQDIIVIAILGGLVLLMLLALCIVCACFTRRIRASEKRLKDVISKISIGPIYQNTGDHNIARRDNPLPPTNFQIRNPQTNQLNSVENEQEWRQLQQILNLRPVLPGERLSNEGVQLTTQDYLQRLSDMQPSSGQHMTSQGIPSPNEHPYSHQQQQHHQPIEYSGQIPLQTAYRRDTDNSMSAFYLPESHLQSQELPPPLPSERRPTTYPSVLHYRQEEEFCDPKDQQAGVPNGYLTVHSPVLKRQLDTFSQPEASFATLPRTRDRHGKTNKNQRIELAHSTERISRV